MTYTGLGALDAHALLARRADQVQRRAARPGVARQEAPGDARDPRALGRRAGRRHIGDRARRDRQRARALAEWNRGRRQARRSSAAAARPGELGEEGAQLEPNVRVALEGFVKRWRRSAPTTASLDWAELMTDPVALAAGFAGSDVTRQGHRAARRVGASGSSRSRSRRPSTRRASRCSTPRAARSAPTRTIRPAGSTTRTIRSCSGSCSSSAAGSCRRTATSSRTEHVAIDEAQDRSALEVKVLVEAVRAPDGDPAEALGDDRRRHRAAPRVRQQLHRLGASCSQQTGQPGDRAAAQAVVSLDRRGHAARARDPRPRARARRAARRAPGRARRAPRVRRPRRGGRVPRRRACAT